MFQICNRDLLLAVSLLSLWCLDPHFGIFGFITVQLMPTSILVLPWHLQLLRYFYEFLISVFFFLFSFIFLLLNTFYHTYFNKNKRSSHKIFYYSKIYWTVLVYIGGNFIVHNTSSVQLADLFRLLSKFINSGVF